MPVDVIPDGPGGDPPADPAPETPPVADPKPEPKPDNKVDRAELEEAIARRQSALERARAAEKQAEELRKKLDTVPTADELAAFRTWRDDRKAAERDKAIKSGDVEAIERSVREPLQQQVAAKDTRVRALETQLTRVLRDSALQAAAVTAGAFDPADVVGLLRDRVRMDSTETGDYVPVFLGPDGQPQYDGRGERVTDAEAFVRLFLAGKPHLVRANVTPGSGGRPAGGSANTTGKVTSLEQLSAMAPEQRKAAIDAMSDEEVARLAPRHNRLASNVI